jgi:hypothetical protein
MPILAFMRHGDALHPPHGLKVRSCLKVINLTEVIAVSLRGIPRVHSAKEYEAKVTARVVAKTLNANYFTHRAISEDNDGEDISAFVRLIVDDAASAVIVTHRVIIGRLIKEIAKQAGKKFIFTDKGSRARILALWPRWIELRPHAIIINTKTMEAKIVSTKEHAQ